MQALFLNKQQGVVQTLFVGDGVFDIPQIHAKRKEKPQPKPRATAGGIFLRKCASSRLKLASRHAVASYPNLIPPVGDGALDVP